MYLFPFEVSSITFGLVERDAIAVAVSLGLQQKQFSKFRLFLDKIEKLSSQLLKLSSDFLDKKLSYF